MPKRGAPDTLSGHAADIWESAYESAWGGTCKDSGDRQEECASRVAWAAVKEKYHQEGDTWKPKAAKEATTIDPRPIRVKDLFSAEEAVWSDDGMRARVTLVRAGLSGNRINWKPEALKRAVERGFWNGTRMFLDHQPAPGGLPMIKKNRSIKDLVSGVESTSFEPNPDRVVGDILFFDKEFAEKARLAAKHLGVSVDLLFRGQEVRGADGLKQKDVEELVVNNSADWVAFPAAGGMIEGFYAQESEENVDWKAVTEEMLREHRPELVAALEGKNTDPDPEPDPPVDPEDRPLTRKELKAYLAQERQSWEADKNKQAEVHRAIEAQVNETALPSKTKARVIASFDGATAHDENAVKEAISAAEEELKAAGFQPRVKNMGRSDPGELPAADRQKIKADQAPTHSALEAAFGMQRAPAGTHSAGGN